MSEAHGAPTGANGVQNGAASAGEVQLELGSQQKVSIHSSDLVKGSTLTSTPVVFRDLTYTVKSNTNKRERAALLKNISGCFEPAQMSALMGPSGSGKTTLLDVLAGRKTQGTIEGEVLFASQKPTINFIRRFTGYVEQFDTLLDILTVREMLLYTAEMKRPVKEKLSEKVKIVDHFVEKLNLTSCKDTTIGNNLNRGISGGQAKRTNIALAMVVLPRVLFLDEPTSGLDSYTANEVMTVVRDLKGEGVTICATIHSPSPYTFDLFDRLLVLVRGEAVYFGPNGDKMLEYFKHTGVAPPASVLSTDNISNNADYLTDLVVGADREGRASEFAAAYDKSDLKREMDGVIARNAKTQSMKLNKEQQTALEVKRATGTPLWKGFATLVKYRTTRNYKNPEFLGPRLGDKVIMSILVSTLYLGIGDDFSLGNVINIGAVLFMWCTLPAFGAASYVPALTMEKALFARERSDGLYKPITYLLSKYFDEIFITTFSSLIFSVFVWFVVDLRGSFLLFWLVYLLTLSIGISLAYLVAILSPNMDVANAALPTYVVTLLFFSGFLFRFDDIPKWWQWYAYIDFLRYAWGAHMVNQFSGTDATVNNQPILEYYGYDGYNKWELLGYEFLFFVCFFFLSWLALQFKRQVKR